MVRKLTIYHPGLPRELVTVSIGVAAKNATTVDEFTVIRDADIALYYEKEHGRN